jgi:hypothetical protein
VETDYCLRRLEIDKDMVVLVYGMRISVRIAPAALKVFAANQAAIDVDVGKGHGAHFLEVKIQNDPINLSGVRNKPTGRH